MEKEGGVLSLWRNFDQRENPQKIIKCPAYVCMSPMNASVIQMWDISVGLSVEDIVGLFVARYLWGILCWAIDLCGIDIVYL